MTPEDWRSKQKDIKAKIFNHVYSNLSFQAVHLRAQTKFNYTLMMIVNINSVIFFKKIVLILDLLSIGSG